MELDEIAITLVLMSIGLGASVVLALIGIALALVGSVTFIYIALTVVKTSHEFEEVAVGTVNGLSARGPGEPSEEILGYQRDILLQVKKVNERLKRLEAG